jgi:hypothetical protein
LPALKQHLMFALCSITTNCRTICTVQSLKHGGA